MVVSDNEHHSYYQRAKCRLKGMSGSMADGAHERMTARREFAMGAELRQALHAIMGIDIPCKIWGKDTMLQLLGVASWGSMAQGLR